MVDKAAIEGYVPGAIGRITELHASYYFKNWGFGLFFEAKVAAELAAFLSRFDRHRDGLWTCRLHNRIEGSIVVDGAKAASEGAHLRWFIISSALRGQGFGNVLMEKAVRYCRAKNYHCMYLWTFAGLDAARHLYEKFGFRLAQEQIGEQWGAKVNEQKFVLEVS
jgi:GNAT superfamily N-acetyltransferase